jgi:hypothetical protein
MGLGQNRSAFVKKKGKNMKWLAFHNGEIIKDNILSLILDQAERGLMRDPDLLLVPDTRKGRADVSGLRKMGRVKRKDCMTLRQAAFWGLPNMPRSSD